MVQNKKHTRGSSLAADSETGCAVLCAGRSAHPLPALITGSQEGGESSRMLVFVTMTENSPRKRAEPIVPGHSLLFSAYRLFAQQERPFPAVTSPARGCLGPIVWERRLGSPLDLSFSVVTLTAFLCLLIGCFQAATLGGVSRKSQSTLKAD